MGRENPWYHPNCAKRRRSYPYNAGNAAVPRRGAGGWLAARRFRQVPFSLEDFSLETLSFAVQTGASARHRLFFYYRLIINVHSRNVKNPSRQKVALLPGFCYSSSSASAISLNTGPQVAPPPVPSSPITVMT